MRLKNIRISGLMELVMGASYHNRFRAVIGPDNSGLPSSDTKNLQVLVQYADSGTGRDSNIYPYDIAGIGINTRVYLNPTRLQLHVAIYRPDKIGSRHCILLDRTSVILMCCQLLYAYSG